MMPVAPLMIEHRLIEKMIAVIENEVDWCERNGNVSMELVDIVIDFIQNYGDRCHHGKEEGILFRELRKKNMSGELVTVMEELMEEHRASRATVARLIKMRDRFIQGDKLALPEIVDCLRFIKTLYPAHIEREDKMFFLPSMDYFSDEEKRALLKEESEFDALIMHRVYRDKVHKGRRYLSCT